MMNPSELRGQGKSTRGKKEVLHDRIGFPEGCSHVNLPKVPHRFLIKRQGKVGNLIGPSQGEGRTP
ncbi:MAG: hypothetical protein ABI618_08150 [Nitrospirota bacterium]